LGDLADGLSKLPSSLPTAIVLANISYTLASDNTPGSLFFGAKLIQPPNVTQPDHKVPSPFSWDLVDVRLRLVGTDVKEAELSTHFTLTDSLPGGRVAQLALNFSYESDSNSSTWELDGSVENLRLSMLGQFFDPNAKDGLIKILERSKSRSWQ